MSQVGSAWAPLLAVLVWGVGACDDSGPLEPTAGSIRVSVATTGSDEDANGYTVSVDGGVALAIDTVAGFLILNNVTPGARSLELGDIAANCAVSGPNPQSVTVVAGDTAQTAFAVACDALVGNVLVRTSTTGDSLDTDGYVARLAGDSAAVGINDSVSFGGVPTGDQVVTLDGVAPNCSVTAASQTVSVPAGGTASADFAIVCAAPAPVGTVIVTTATSGDSLDADGYMISVAGLSDSIGINDTIIFAGVAVGTSVVQLGGIAANCSVAPADTASITLIGGDSANVSFVVTCAPPAPVSQAGRVQTSPSLNGAQAGRSTRTHQRSGSAGPAEEKHPRP